MRGVTLLALASSLATATAFQSSWFRGPQVAKQQQQHAMRAVTRPFRRNPVAPTMMAPATDEALLQTGPGGGGGMFTSSNPEDRRIVPANANGRATFKVVYVVLESQYQASMSAAATKINENQDGLAVEVVGYLLEELRDEGNFAAFKADIADANIFIGSLIFVQELAEKVRERPPPPFPSFFDFRRKRFGHWTPPRAPRKELAMGSVPESFA